MKLRNNLEKSLLGNGCILVATIFWGVNYAFTKALIPDFMGANDISAVRLVGGCILFWLASLFLRAEKLDAQSLARAAVGGAIGLFCCIWLFVLSFDYGSPIDIAIIMTLPPVFVILMEVLFMGRRPSIMEYCGIALSFAGAAMVILGGGRGTAGSDYLKGDLLALGSSFSFAIYLVVLAKPTDHYRAISLLRWVFLFAAIPALFFVPPLFDAPILHTDHLAPWSEIAFILFCPTFLAYLLQEPAIRMIGPVIDSLYQYLTPVVAAIAAILLGVDQPRWEQGIAMFIIIAGMVLTDRGKKRERPKKAH